MLIKSYLKVNAIVTAASDNWPFDLEQKTWMQVKTKTRAPPVEILKQVGTLIHLR